MLLDPTSPDSEAVSLYAEASGSGIATCFHLNGYRTMTIEQFKQEVVPTLKTSDAESKFSYYVLRDLSNGRYITVMPDGVIEYKVSSVNECSLEALKEKLLAADREQQETLAPIVINSPFPVYSYAEKGDLWEITVKTPETRFRYKHEGLFRNPDEAPFIYMPPLLYTVMYSGQIFRNSWVSLLQADSVDPQRIVKAHLPLPNIWTDTRICVGSTHVVNVSDKPLSKMQLLLQSWDLFLNGIHNNDLLRDDLFPVNLDSVFESLSLKLETYMLQNSPEHIYLFKLLKILEQPGRWELLEWKAI